MTLFRIFRSEYFFGLWVGCIANLTLWFDPERSPSFFIILLTLFYAGLFYSAGFLADSLWDADLEITYENEKQQLARIVNDFGKQRLKFLLYVSLCVAGILSILLAWLIQSAIPFTLFIVGLICGIGYSAPPLRFKHRGFLLHAISLGVSAFFLPVFLVVGILQSDFTGQVFILGMGFSMTHYALEIGNQLKDQKFDALLKIHTLPYTDIRSNAVTALTLLVLGLAITTIVLANHFHFSIWLLVIVSLVILLAHRGPLIVFWKSAYENPNADTFLSLNYPSWQTRSMVGLFLIALITRF